MRNPAGLTQAESAIQPSTYKLWMLLIFSPQGIATKKRERDRVLPIEIKSALRVTDSIH